MLSIIFGQLESCTHTVACDPQLEERKEGQIIGLLLTVCKSGSCRRHIGVIENEVPSEQ